MLVHTRSYMLLIIPGQIISKFFVSSRLVIVFNTEENYAIRQHRLQIIY